MTFELFQFGFHFLRPLWLLTLPAIGVCWWLLRQREKHADGVRLNIAPHLKDALTVHPQGARGIEPVDSLALTLYLLALAAAGPTFSRAVSPWFAETAPLVIAMEVTDSMRANDVSPTRLDRARFKVLDLIAARTGARTAIIAYAGSAHILVPPSSDPAVLKPLLESLDPAIMPSAGARAAAALPLARELLGPEAALGTILFVTNGFEADDIAAIQTFEAEPGGPALQALVLGTAEGGVALLPDGTPALGPGGGRVETRLDTGLLARVARETGMAVVRLQADGSDITRLLRGMRSQLLLADDPNAEWEDRGGWLLWPAALLCLFWFRKGWTLPT